MGSKALQDEPLDIQANFQGVFVLAKIGNYFCLESKCSDS